MGTHASQSYKVILIGKTKTAKQLIGNGRGSIVFIGTIAVGLAHLLWNTHLGTAHT